MIGEICSLKFTVCAASGLARMKRQSRIVISFLIRFSYKSIFGIQILSRRDQTSNRFSFGNGYGLAGLDSCKSLSQIMAGRNASSSAEAKKGVVNAALI